MVPNIWTYSIKLLWSYAFCFILPKNWIANILINWLTWIWTVSEVSCLIISLFFLLLPLNNEIKEVVAEHNLHWNLVILNNTRINYTRFLFKNVYILLKTHFHYKNDKFCISLTQKYFVTCSSQNSLRSILWCRCTEHKKFETFWNQQIIENIWILVHLFQ